VSMVCVILPVLVMWDGRGREGKGRPGSCEVRCDGDAMRLRAKASDGEATAAEKGDSNNLRICICPRATSRSKWHGI
jgi:hypothetical protein